MSAIRLLVLGAVRQHGRAHGYMIRNDLEFWGAHEWSNAKPGSIYHALKQLAKQELLTAHETAPSTAGGPPRTEYEVTEAGHAEFLRLLRHALTSIDEKPDMLTSAVGFIVDLPRAEAIDLLRERVASLEAWRAEVMAHWTPEGAGPEETSHIGEIMGLWVHTSDSGAQWTRGLIERLEGGAYVMEGEGERDVQVLPEGVPNPYADVSRGDAAGSAGHQIEVAPVEPGTTRVRVLRGDVELARSERPLILRETGYPDRYYLPPEDVHTRLLTPTPLTTHCPFKGDASYWAVRATAEDGDKGVVEVAWAYPEPKPQVAAIRDHLCFYDGKDGVRVELSTPAS